MISNSCAVAAELPLATTWKGGFGGLIRATPRVLIGAPLGRRLNANCQNSLVALYLETMNRVENDAHSL